MSAAVVAKTAASKSSPEPRRTPQQPMQASPLTDLVTRLGNRGLQRLRPIQRKCSCGGSCPSCREEEELRLQRKSNGEPPLSHGIALAHDVASRPGQPLEPSVRTDMEHRLGADF